MYTFRYIYIYIYIIYTVGRKTIFSCFPTTWHHRPLSQTLQVSPWLIWSQHISFSYYKWKKYKRWSQDNWRRIPFLMFIWILCDICWVITLMHITSTWLKSWFSLQNWQLKPTGHEAKDGGVLWQVGSNNGTTFFSPWGVASLSGKLFYQGGFLWLPVAS